MKIVRYVFALLLIVLVAVLPQAFCQSTPLGSSCIIKYLCSRRWSKQRDIKLSRIRETIHLMRGQDKVRATVRKATDVIHNNG